MLKSLINSFLWGIFWLFFAALPLSGCFAWWGYNISKTSSTAASSREPPPPGTLLKPQIRVGISPDYPPLASKDARFGLVGIEVELANELAKQLGKQFLFVETPFPELIKALLEDRIDIIMSGMSVTAERVKLVNFTDSYALIGQMALVRANDASSYPSVQAFWNTKRKVGFVRDTTGELAARGLFLHAKIVAEPTVQEGVAALRKGEIDVFIHDAPTIWRIAGNPREQELKGLYWRLTDEYLAWAVRKEDEPLRFAINRELTQIRQSGRLTEILSRWAGLRIW